MSVQASGPTKPPEDRRTLLLGVPLEPKYDQPLKLAARREGRSVSGHVRFLILKDLQEREMVDEDFVPIIEPDEAEAANG
jgi:hypothetical protein